VTHRRLRQEPDISAGDRLQCTALAGPGVPQQARTDIIGDDLDAAQALALALGATRMDRGGPHYRAFTCLAGHPIDLSL
jgi:hypothetical protein